MKKAFKYCIFLSLVIVTVFLSFNGGYVTGPPFIQNESIFSSGGPDSFGYTWRDTILTAGTLGFKDTTWGTGTWTRVNGLGDDNLVGPFAMGWSFRYYYYNVNQFWIGSNGWLTFRNPGASQLASPFPNIPATTPPNDLVVPYAADLNFTGTNNPGRVYYYTNNTDTSIISFYSVPFWQQAAPTFNGANTFQVIFTSADSSITFKYKDTSGTLATPDLVTGIENLTGLIGLQVSRNAYATENKEVKFKYPPVVTYQVRDVTVKSVDNPNNGGIIKLVGDTIAVNAVIENVGNVNVSSFSAAMTIRTVTNTLVRSDTVSVPALNAGANSPISFNNTFIPTTPGFYFIRVRTLLVGDQVTLNDSTQIELNVLPRTGVMELAYENGLANGTGISWSGGSGSVGTYFIPPIYPVRIDTVKFYMTNVAAGYTAKILDDDGANGTPGTQLFSQVMPPATVNTFAKVPVTGVNITSGGFYVIWQMGGESVQLATNITAPISRRSIEGFGNDYAPFRRADTDDPLIRATVFSSVIGIQQVSSEVPVRFSLEQNYPNPFNPATNIKFSIPKQELVKLVVYDILGKEVATLVNENMSPGIYKVDFPARTGGNGSAYASGIYFYRIESASFTDVKKMILIK
ncbi:MAG: T9SS type A sorting domain-containing protein [Ignavibacteria bacterium]|nr:T9SS type A sorting domain-containing protein [Ignavibacteria bacterium]